MYCSFILPMFSFLSHIKDKLFLCVHCHMTTVVSKLIVAAPYVDDDDIGGQVYSIYLMSK